MNLSLAPAEEAFRAEVRDFLATSLTEDLRRAQRRTTGVYPEPAVSRPWQAMLAQKGWLAAAWPRQHGGPGWSAVQRFIFETECAQADAPLVHPMGIRLVAPVIMRFGTPAQQAQHLPGILSGADYWCQGFSEPGAGSDLAALRTQAVADGSDYVLNGSKIWTTHAQHANRMFALVRTGAEGRRQDGISFLLLDMQAPGITVRPIATMGGDADVNEVFFDNVRVPQSWRIGPEGGGWACAKVLLEFERGAGIASPRLRAQLRRVGDALAATLGAGVLAKPAMASRFGEVLADLDAFEMLELRTLGSLQPGQAPGPVASILKLRASRLRQSIAQLGLQAIGQEAVRLAEPGADGDAAVEAMLPDYLNSRAYTIFGGAAEIQLGIIAKTLCLAPP